MTYFFVLQCATQDQQVEATPTQDAQALQAQEATVDPLSQESQVHPTQLEPPVDHPDPIPKAETQQSQVPQTSPKVMRTKQVANTISLRRSVRQRK